MDGGMSLGGKRVYREESGRRKNESTLTIAQTPVPTAVLDLTGSVSPVLTPNNKSNVILAWNDEQAAQT